VRSSVSAVAVTTDADKRCVTPNRSPWDTVVIRGHVADRSFVAFYLEDGRVIGAFGVNRGRDIRRARALIATGDRVPEAQLSDEGTDLRQLLT
jgi:3-phenylpropionate/trans-cinnamate dioxygenase ferredoxin reductase subunit